MPSLSSMKTASVMLSSIGSMLVSLMVSEKLYVMCFSFDVNRGMNLFLLIYYMYIIRSAASVDKEKMC